MDSATLWMLLSQSVRGDATQVRIWVSAPTKGKAAKQTAATATIIIRLRIVHRPMTVAPEAGYDSYSCRM
jgi:hypothetical protein